MVDAGEYFTINRARQYGKTTLLAALAEYLKSDYKVISLDFQTISYGDFENEEKFVADIVQGHVDQTAVCTAKEDADGSWYFTFEYEPQGGGLCTVEKGSVTVNGVSLTVCDSKESSFRVAIRISAGSVWGRW